MTNWQPGRWWRVVDHDGRVWMETSNEHEAKHEAAIKKYKLFRTWHRSEEEWRAEW